MINYRFEKINIFFLQGITSLTKYLYHVELFDIINM